MRCTAEHRQPPLSLPSAIDALCTLLELYIPSTSDLLTCLQYELGCAQREAAFQKLCVYWEGKVAAAIKAKNYGW